MSFAAGLKACATVATVGLLAHAEVLSLPQRQDLLSGWQVIGASAALFGVEFSASVPSLS